jgi:hypothetical protein
MIIEKMTFVGLVISQLTLLGLYVLLARSIAELRHEAHHHTFFFDNDGKKIDEFISVYKHGGVINEQLR